MNLKLSLVKVIFISNLGFLNCNTFYEPYLEGIHSLDVSVNNNNLMHRPIIV